ncbi:PREDICTED: jouberin-like [Ceratosolen solmsi marchali]|uniref:Jouberin-like n=1 Tax=Ceratosolen solmsi marchali TaxID=326594 RepID=A0AAJ6YJM3_9HYME|nr:PREDICTED: jouberin-like [Ceratosolen solmsi marchali]
MDRQQNRSKESRSRASRKGIWRRAGAAAGSDESSATDEKSDEELDNTGSRIRLFREKRKGAKSSTKSRRHEEAEVSREPAKASQPPRESSIAQSIKKRFAFFRRSENVKSTEDVEAVIIDNDEAGELVNRVVDVVVDVHRENGERRKEMEDKGRIGDGSSDSSSSRKSLVLKSLDLIEEFHEERIAGTESANSRLSGESEAESEVDVPTKGESEGSLEEPTSDVLPMSGAESTRRRRRWDKSEIAAGDLVEDLKKPRRRQWVMDATGTESRKNVGGRKDLVSKRSTTVVTTTPRSANKPLGRVWMPKAAPRSKSKRRDHRQAFDNEVFSYDHDEVLRIETINDSSPKIKIGNLNLEQIENEVSTLSNDEDNAASDSMSRIEKVQEHQPLTADEDDEMSDTTRDDESSMGSSESLDFVGRKSTARRRPPSGQQKLSANERSVDREEPEDIDEAEDEQETILNVIEKKSVRSSSSSKIEIIPRNFFGRKSSEETTITTYEDTSTSRRGSRHSRSRGQQVKPAGQKRSGNAIESSSRLKSKTTSSSTRNSTEEYSSNRRKAKPKARKRHKRKDNRQEPEGDRDEDIKYTSIWIHRSDMLEADYVTRHPMVKVHIVSQETGEYLKSRNKEKNAIDFLQPIITGKFDFKEKRSMLPIWDEELIFEQDFQDLLREGRSAALVLFEIVDLLNYSEASVCYDQFGRDACWYKVAWAFLRPVGISGVHHVDKRLRLQLYRPKKNFRKTAGNQCEVYRWWKSNSRNKYPSSLYVSLSGVEPPKLEPVFYEQPLHLEDVGGSREGSRVPEETEPPPPKWSRPATQTCQIPNESFVEFEASENGCFHLAFSNDGKYLACVLSEEHDYPILVYKVHDGSIHVRFPGHKSFIYSLGWARDDRFLLSVSSDRTARFWNVRDRIIEHIQSLPHPSYVYCGKFSMEVTDYIVTGCYDKVARVWALLPSGDNEGYELVQELEIHESFVNSVCLQTENDTFFTGDGLGVIVAWFAKRSRKSPIRKEWQIMRKIKIRELEGVPINTIILHPLGSRLLVHSRNNGLRLMDLRSGTVLRKFDGLTNQRIQITACISPCGSLLFCGSEDATLSVWSLQSGKLLAIYEMGIEGKAVTCVDYHPNDHLLALAVWGAPVPVKIMKFDREAEGKSVGLKLTATTDDTVPASFDSKLSSEPTSLKNGGGNLELMPTRSRSSSIKSGLLRGQEVNDDVRVRLTRAQIRANESNLKAKSLTRLNGIIEKIDRILMYATTQNSPDVDVESARDSSIFTVTGVREARDKAMETIELEELRSQNEKSRSEPRAWRKHRHRSRSARNSTSALHKEIEVTKALSDSAAFNRKVSRFSDESSNSNRSAHHKKKLVVERLELDRIDGVESTDESGFKDSLGTIVDGKEEFPSEEILDIESLRSDDTYVVDKVKNNSAESADRHDLSDESNATFIIESDIPIAKPRKKFGKVVVM